MADEENFPDEEYQFSEIESDDVFASQEADKPDHGQQQVRKRIMIGIGVIVVVLAVYKLLGLFFAPKQPKTPVVQPVVTQPLIKIQPAVQRPVSLPRGVTKILAELQQQANDNARTINGLRSRLDEMQTTLRTMNRGIATIENNLQSIQKQLQVVKKPRIKPPKVVKKRRRRVIRPPVKLHVYYIKAIIPGRAWLKTANGTTITISEGKSIKGYGKIIKIDAQQGRVTTSSGRQIRFSPDEL